MSEKETQIIYRAGKRWWVWKWGGSLSPPPPPDQFFCGAVLRSGGYSQGCGLVLSQREWPIHASLSLDFQNLYDLGWDLSSCQASFHKRGWCIGWTVTGTKFRLRCAKPRPCLTVREGKDLQATPSGHTLMPVIPWPSACPFPHQGLADTQQAHVLFGCKRKWQRGNNAVLGYCVPQPLLLWSPESLFLSLAAL